MTVKFFTDINNPRMKNFLHFDLMQKIYNCLAHNHLLDEHYPTFQAAFKDDFTRLDQAMLISRKSLLTPEIQSLDTQRVQEWRIVRSAAHESTKLKGEAQASAADFVMSLINNHGDIQNMKVTERTGALTNLCQDLTEKYADQVAAIHLTAYAAQLSATNALYLSKYEERLHEWSEYTDGEVQAARKAIDDSLENLCIMVASGILTQGFAPFKHFVDYTNEAIKVAKIAMGVSTTKPEGGEPAGGEETTPPAGGGTEGEQQPGEGEQQPGTGTEQKPGEGEQQPGETEQEPTLYKITYMHKGQVYAVQEYEVGARITTIDPPQGYYWRETTPGIMPAHDITITSTDDPYGIL